MGGERSLGTLTDGDQDLLGGRRGGVGGCEQSRSPRAVLLIDLDTPVLVEVDEVLDQVGLRREAELHEDDVGAERLLLAAVLVGRRFNGMPRLDLFWFRSRLFIHQRRGNRPVVLHPLRCQCGVSAQQRLHRRRV